MVLSELFEEYTQPDLARVEIETKDRPLLGLTTVSAMIDGQRIGHGLIHRIGTDKLTVHGTLAPEARRLGLARRFVEIARATAEKEGRQFVSPEKINPDMVSADGQKFLRGMNYFRGKAT